MGIRVEYFEYYVELFCGEEAVQEDNGNLFIYRSFVRFQKHQKPLQISTFVPGRAAGKNIPAALKTVP